MTTPYFVAPVIVFPVYLTLETDAEVAPLMVLILMPLSDAVTTLLEMVTPETVDPAATDPIEMPCPPLHLLLRNEMLDPLLTARQSSWLSHELFWIVNPVALTSKQSELWPRALPSEPSLLPALLSMWTPSMSRVDCDPIDIVCRGVFLMLRFLSVPDEVMEKNFGLSTPPLPPWPSQ